MIEGLAVIGTRATWNLAHSATPDAPVVPELDRERRRPVVRPHVAHAMRWLAELLDPGRPGGRLPLRGVEST